jgi:hypothetical protein
MLTRFLPGDVYIRQSIQMVHGIHDELHVQPLRLMILVVSKTSTFMNIFVYFLYMQSTMAPVEEKIFTKHEPKDLYNNFGSKTIVRHEE